MPVSGDNAVATEPRIVNGLTVRPRKKAKHNLWLYSFILLPDFIWPLVIAGLGMRRLLRYLDAKSGRVPKGDA
jgi:hypothetical protein